MSQFRPLTQASLQLLRRLALYPRLRLSSHADELGISRSAVSQLMHNLKVAHNAHIRSLPIFGHFGLNLLFGWASAEIHSQALSRFSKWLNSYPNVYFLVESDLTSKLDFRIYFEALFFSDEKLLRFLRQLNRFMKQPYSLNLTYDFAKSMANHLNLARFNGRHWEVEHEFHLSAQLNVMKSFSEILPVALEPIHSSTDSLQILDFIVLLSLQQNYFATHRDVLTLLKKYGIPTPSGRTIRRRLARLREKSVIPYLYIERIGLTQRILITINDLQQPRRISRLLIAQAGMLPLTRIISNDTLTVLDLLLPPTFELSKFSSSITSIAGHDAQVCTFLSNATRIEKELEETLHYIINSKVHNSFEK